MRILGIAGQQGAGKDYLHQRLEAMLSGSPDHNVRRIGLADGVRREVTVEVLSAFPSINIGDTDGAGIWAKPYTEGQRWILQQWGTEFRRAQHPDYWVNYTMQYIDERAQDDDLWCITDVRFQNEAGNIQRAGGKVVEVKAPADVRARRLGLTMQELDERSRHASEVIDFDTDWAAISNDQGLIIVPEMVDWLGLPSSCTQCMRVLEHIYHDNGTVLDTTDRRNDWRPDR